jgi:hypothetical protein
MIEDSHDQDYRQVLARIIGDYLFRCPNQYYAKQLSGLGDISHVDSGIYLYEFALPTRTPGFPCCDGLACHTCEVPYVFNQLEVIEADYSWSEDSSQLQDDVGGLPDMFGASPTRRTQSTGGESNRGTVDAEVSSLMADFWTSFARYGDPNGLSSTNGYVEGTGPSGHAPFWPRLLGDLTSPSDKDGHVELSKLSAAKMAEENVLETFRRIKDDNTDIGVAVLQTKGEEFEVYSTVEEVPSRNSPQERYSGGNGDADDVTLDGEELLDRPSDEELYRFMRAARYTSHSDREGSEGDDNYLRTSRGRRGRNSAATSRKSKIAAFKSSKESVATARDAMHQMIFDEEQDVKIFINDCICNAWNRLEYVF